MSQAPDSAVVASATTAAAATAAAAKDPKTQKALVSLEEDDEFEDFPVEGMAFGYIWMGCVV